eukprot:gnl/MRDRNA2_/MRDRNA2_95571_c0_seq1.p1 gnl/MRDRNA2_/MRDRNA2_95571_c0~~gnl/MRDRNA2_/MRDRNA2_95571_c0_seq1.p1  ORF type:complete len:524 (+),score=120.24 gnl/MRDRNA2_/MRDRNA2_95571_c0_seq1:66-1574(+)
MSGYTAQSAPDAPRKEPDEKLLIGWHNMYWAKAQLKVCFRPGGFFFCQDPQYQAAATWKIFDGEILIDWCNFGRYALAPDEGKHTRGYAVPKDDDDENNWRKTIYFGGLSDLEKMLFGDGEGTEWDFETPDGHFALEFRPDGLNHCVCKTHEGDAHWSIDKKGKTIFIDFGKNKDGKGIKYELDVDVKKKQLDGYLITEGVEDPDEDKDWRKAEFKRNLVKPEPLESHENDDAHGEGHSHGHSHGDGHGHSHGEAHGSDFDHGIVGLGNMTIGSEKFMVDREGQLAKGFNTEFGFERVGPGDSTGFKAWVQDAEGKPLCDPVEGESHGGHLHFMMMPMTAGAEKFAVSCGDKVGTVSVHPGAGPTNDGIMNVLEDADGKHVGFIELKLHDDAGDLELWLCKDGAMSEPLDFPADTTITATFATKGDKSVSLNVRDDEKNEDEDGNPNMRDGKMTNYFIFPGESDQDPEFLIGEDFRSTTTLTFTAGGKTYTSPPFVLVPHQH